MRKQSISNPFTGAVQYPNSIAFMYSRQPVIITGNTTAAYDVTVRVTCTSNGDASHTETRKMYEGRAEFDISRIMQTLARDVDGVLQRVDYTQPATLSERFTIEVSVGATKVLSIDDITALYGALDAAEVYGAKATRRLFLNHPQTFNIWKNIYGGFSATIGGIELNPTPADAQCSEVCLRALVSGAILSALQSGVALSGTTSWLYRIQEGAETAQTARSLTFVPDNTPRGCGVYLRWLNRRGEVSHWLFDRVQIETAASVTESFKRYYEGDPSVPENQVFKNSDKRNYEEQRRMGIAAGQVSAEEFDDLCTLLTSPVVEMLYTAEEYHALGFVVNGGTAAAVGEDRVDGQGADAQLASLDGGGAQETQLHYSEEDRWIRVNVDGGTQARNVKRNTPRLHDFEATITLMPRNTAKL